MCILIYRKQAFLILFILASLHLFDLWGIFAIDYLLISNRTMVPRVPLWLKPKHRAAVIWRLDRGWLTCIHMTADTDRSPLSQEHLHRVAWVPSKHGSGLPLCVIPQREQRRRYTVFHNIVLRWPLLKQSVCSKTVTTSRGLKGRGIWACFWITNHTAFLSVSGEAQNPATSVTSLFFTASLRFHYGNPGSLKNKFKIIASLGNF